MKTFIQLMLEVRTGQTFGDGEATYSVDKIIRKSQIKRANVRKVSHLIDANKDLTTTEGNFHELLRNPTPEFMARVKKADTRFPIHIDGDGNIIDGAHRLAAHYFAGKKRAKVHVVGSRTLDKTEDKTEIKNESVNELPLSNGTQRGYVPVKQSLLSRLKKYISPSRPPVDRNEIRRRMSRGGSLQGNLSNRGIGFVDESHILDQPAVTTEPGGRHPDIVVDNTKERERGWNWDRKQDSGTPDAYDSAIEYWHPDSTVRTDIKHTRGDATKRPDEVGSSHVEVHMNGDWYKSRNGFKLPGDAGAQIDVAKAHLEHHIRTWKPHTISYSTSDPRKDMFYRAYLGKHHPHIKIINRYELEPVEKIRSLNRWIGSREKEIEAERSEAQRRQDALHASARSFVSSQVDEAAKTTGEYRKAALDAAAREEAYRKSVAPRQKKLQGRPIKLRKKTMAQIAAGFKAHQEMKAEYKAEEPTSWSPSPEASSAGSYIRHGHRFRNNKGAWAFGSTGPLGDGMDNPPDLWFSHGGDHLAIHSAVNRGNPTGGQLHSDLPGFHRAEGQDPLIQGRIDHARKRITYLSLQTRASGFGERVINAQKRRMANRLAKKYPGYTHHDSDNNQEPF